MLRLARAVAAVAAVALGAGLALATSAVDDALAHVGRDLPVASAVVEATDPATVAAEVRRVAALP
ncbi:hypothetical protein ACFUMH_02745 [Cellulomonas sp. NPDC057328]|uniref:hypothetical protein n=1 Tax=Cellulomonas sp. NPDC057328 TaxID=3346101 RepID=UPI00363CA950